MILIQYTLIYVSVLILVALGSMFSEHSGVVNLELEGVIVAGALGGAFVLHLLPPGTVAPLIILLSVLVSAVAEMVFSLLLAVAAINFRAD